MSWWEKIYVVNSLQKLPFRKNAIHFLTMAIFPYGNFPIHHSVARSANTMDYQTARTGSVKSKHLKGRLVPRVCDVFGSTTILVIGCPLSVTFLDQQQSGSLHYGKVIMGRRKFNFTAIRRKVSLSLSNLFGTSRLWVRGTFLVACQSRHIFGSEGHSWQPVRHVTFLGQRDISGPLRAERRRREARREVFTTLELVTAQRSILGPPAEGRPGPSNLNNLNK